MPAAPLGQCNGDRRPAQSLISCCRQSMRGRQRGELFAWRVKKLAQAAWPEAVWVTTQLFGTGWPFRSVLLLDRDLGNSRLAGRLCSGDCLASEGYPRFWSSEAKVYSHFPVSQVGSEGSVSVGRKGISTTSSIWFRGALAQSLRREIWAWLRSPSTWRCLPVACCACHSRLEILGAIAFVLGAQPAALAIFVLERSASCARNCAGRDS